MVPTSDQIEDLFRPRERWQSWLEVEAALATAQAEFGMIPVEAGAEISRKAHLEHIDIDEMTAEMARSKAPVLAMVHALADVCDGDAGQYVHWGGTTQNIIMTGQVLQIRKVHRAILVSMANCFEAMARLAEDGSEMIMAGRTNGQHALPITFGFKVASWIEEFTRFETRFREVEPRIFSLVFGGAVGAMQAFGDKGPLLTRHMGRDLELRPVTVPSRAMVDHFVEYISLLVLFGTSCSRIAREVFSLMAEEIGEVSENLDDGVIGSSTMPQKVNPKLSVSIIAAATQLRGYLIPAMEAGQPNHEGDAAANQALYATIDVACPLAYRIVSDTSELLTRLQPLPDRMGRNLAQTNGMIAAENVMMLLAGVHGRQTAHDLVHSAVAEARVKEIPLADALIAMEPVRDSLSEETLRAALKPENYTGECVAIARQAVTLAQEAAARLRT